MIPRGFRVPALTVPSGEEERRNRPIGKIAAFLQMYNELENGNLVRCLKNTKKWADEIFIYDDCSTDGSKEVYLQYTPETHIIFGTERNFALEIHHKALLLELVLTFSPDWIVWQDGDAIMDRNLTEGMRAILQTAQMQGADALKVHYLNLWRHPCFYRLDSSFNSLNTISFWYNSGRLHYQLLNGLHQPQYPQGIDSSRVVKVEHNILHYGFAYEKSIVRKYLTYKSYGQTGVALNRLIDETTLDMAKVPKELYPLDNLPLDYDTCEKPVPKTYDEYRGYNNWNEYKDTLQ